MKHTDTHDARKAAIEDRMTDAANDKADEIARLTKERNDALDLAAKYKSALYLHVEYPSLGAAWEKAAEWNIKAGKLRAALEKLVGASSREELEAMRTVMGIMPDCDEKQAGIGAVNALLETL